MLLVMVCHESMSIATAVGNLPLGDQKKKTCEKTSGLWSAQRQDSIVWPGRCRFRSQILGMNSQE